MTLTYDYALNSFCSTEAIILPPHPSSSSILSFILRTWSVGHVFISAFLRWYLLKFPLKDICNYSKRWYERQLRERDSDHQPTAHLSDHRQHQPWVPEPNWRWYGNGNDAGRDACKFNGVRWISKYQLRPPGMVGGKRGLVVHPFSLLGYKLSSSLLVHFA